MKLSELMRGKTVNPDFEGFATNDDWVLAVNIEGPTASDPKNYAVAQLGIAGLDSQLNPVTQDNHYIRAGQSTMKTGEQRSFKITGDRYIGDPFQDYCFSRNIKFGTGQAVIVDYVYFCILNGKGEKGKVSIIVNSDGSGQAGENSGVDIDLKKAGAMPVEFIYTE